MMRAPESGRRLRLQRKRHVSTGPLKLQLAQTDDQNRVLARPGPSTTTKPDLKEKLFITPPTIHTNQKSAASKHMGTIRITRHPHHPQLHTKARGTRNTNSRRQGKDHHPRIARGLNLLETASRPLQRHPGGQ